MKTIPSNPARRVTCLLIALVLAALAAPLGRAQTGLGLPDRGRQAAPLKVGTVTIKFVGTASVNEQVVRANMRVREGAELDEAMIDQDIRSLYRTGLFEFVQVERSEISPNNTVDFVFEVTPKFRVMAIYFDGNSRIKDGSLEKEIKSTPNLALDERQVKEDAEKLREYYQKAGYNEVSVTYSIDRDRSTGFGTITFKIKEGARVKIAEVRFEGNEHFKSGRFGSVFKRGLHKQIETRKWWFLSWLTGTGRFKDEQFEDDLDKLRDFYRENGFLDVEIAPEKIQFDYPKPGRLVITIPINEGRQYRIGDIGIKGNKVYPSSLLMRILRQKTGDVFVPSKLDKDTERLQDFYGRDGYLDTRVRLVRKPNVNTGNIDVDYEVLESEKFYVESVNIEGNTKTRSTVILRELTLGPGDVFNAVSMKISKLRLENTRFFDDVNVQDEPTNLPGRRNLKVAVREGRTGNLTFGAGFSSLEQATLFAEFSQSNFDLFNHRSLFQGDGQKFRLRMQLGSQSSEVLLSFEEPWLFDQQLALGFTVFRTSSDYNSAFYEEIRTGGELYLRKMLFPRHGIEGRLAYSYEIVEIADVDPTASEIIRSLEGNSKVSKLSFQLLRDSRDKLINTTRGNRIEINTALAGGLLGGDQDYYSLEFRGSQFFPVFETQTQVLSLRARAGVIQNYGDSRNVPYYDRFFLGGPYNLRGFEYRDVGPRDTFDEPIGGKSYGFFSAEYSLDIVSPIRFAIFYDAGFVNEDAYEFSPVRYNDNFGFGLRLFVAGAPLSLDFGIPITGDKINKKGNQFNFSFGTQY